MRPRRRPGLTPEDEALWREVTRGAVPLAPEQRRAAGPSEAPPESSPQRPAARRPAGPATAPAEAGAGGSAGQERAPRRVLRPTGPLADPARPGLDLAAPVVAPRGRAAPGLDRRTAERIRRGTRAPEARIDLHGLTAERAHRALERCIAGALAAGHRLVLVITGKGGRRESAGSPFARPGEGVLRREAPRWLKAGPYARDIVAILEAHPRHGGTGAFYVYLKKRR